MPIIGAVVLLIQFSFAFHALKTGRPYWWLFVIMAFPVIGCVLYYFVEVFPASRESRRAEKAVRSVIKSLDPEKDLRARVADLETCGSVDNRIALARECIDQKQFHEAATLYRSCLSGIHEGDPEIRLCLANALVLAGEFQEALTATERLRKDHPSHRASEVSLLLASALEGVGQLESALEEFRTVADTYPGEEARWRYAALLKRLGRIQDAQDVFQRMIKNAERQPRHYREAQREWLNLARQNMQA